MAKPKTVWLGARGGFASDDFGAYEVGIRKASFNEKYGFDGQDYLTGFCSKDFERVTGFKMKPGEIKKVRIIIEEV